MKSHLCILLLVSTVVIAGMIPARLSSQIRNVPGDYPTIQQAINAAGDGDTVLVAEGTYYENVLIDSTGVILGSHFIID